MQVTSMTPTVPWNTTGPKYPKYRWVTTTFIPIAQALEAWNSFTNPYESSTLMIQYPDHFNLVSYPLLELGTRSVMVSVTGWHRRCRRWAPPRMLYSMLWGGGGRGGVVVGGGGGGWGGARAGGGGGHPRGPWQWA